MALNYEEVLVFNALAIRNTSAQTSTAIDCRWCQVKGIIIENNLNQSVSVQFQGSRTSDFAEPVDIGSPVEVAAGANSLEDFDAFVPYLRAVATCSVAPASGALTVAVLNVSEA